MTTHTASKALRLITTGRVRVLEASAEQGNVFAEVRGDRGTYIVSHNYPGPGWHCECPAHRFGHERCSHIEAVAAVFAPEPLAALRVV